jgi:NADH-quinone oxidoreductase subunit A
MTDLVLFILIFLAAGLAVLGGNLLLGKMVRPHKPNAEKGTVYECGEPTIGSAWIQFDLRFYVVALLFVIFDVELAFFFPWAVVFGSANRAGDESLALKERYAAEAALQPAPKPPTPVAASPPEQLGKADAGAADKPSWRASTVAEPEPAAYRRLAWIAFLDIMIFFAVLLVGFAYLWRRGDLAWVRSTAAQTGVEAPVAVE